MDYEKYLKEKRIKQRKDAYNKFTKYYNKYQLERYRNEPKFKLDRNIGRSIRRTLREVKNPKENHWKLILGYTIAELKERLISTIPEGYIWQDYLDGELELDHITPVRTYYYTNVIDDNFKISWGIDNLRLLPKKLNRIKGGRENIYMKSECLPCLK